MLVATSACDSPASTRRTASRRISSSTAWSRLRASRELSINVMRLHTQERLSIFRKGEYAFAVTNPQGNWTGTTSFISTSGTDATTGYTLQKFTGTQDGASFVLDDHALGSWGSGVPAGEY